MEQACAGPCGNPIVDGNATAVSTIPYGSDEWKQLYRGRSAVEREFGRVKID